MKPVMQTKFGSKGNCLTACMVWTLVWVTQKLNDEYGSSLSEVKLFDKVALTD